MNTITHAHTHTPKGRLALAMSHSTAICHEDNTHDCVLLMDDETKNIARVSQPSGFVVHRAPESYQTSHSNTQSGHIMPGPNARTGNGMENATINL